MMVGKPTPNKTNINNLIENQTMRASGEPPTAYGRYENIFLSKDEYDELQAEYPDRLERLIEEMSHYLAASGKATRIMPPPCTDGRPMTKREP